MLITEPGIYPNISNEDYHQSKGLSSSRLGLLLPPSCPANFWHHHLSGEVIRDETESFSLGSAVHTYCFEPDMFKSRFYIVREIPKRNSNLGKAAYEAMIKEADGRQILTHTEYDTCVAMGRKVITHAMWITLMQRVKDNQDQANIETSIAWEDDDIPGVLLRSRPDFFTQSLIIDLKTTKDSTPYGFQKAVMEYGYHRQAAMACDGLIKCTGAHYENVVLFVVDKRPPHFVRCYVLSEAAINQGRYEYKTVARLYAECMRNNSWPGYPEMIEDLDLPQWGYRSMDNE